MIKERFDRGVVNDLWMEQFPEAIVSHLIMEESDHCPIVVLMDKRREKIIRPFRFFEAWTSDISSTLLLKKPGM